MAKITVDVNINRDAWSEAARKAAAAARKAHAGAHPKPQPASHAATTTQAKEADAQKLVQKHSAYLNEGGGASQGNALARAIKKHAEKHGMTHAQAIAHVEKHVGEKLNIEPYEVARGRLSL